ncbi:MurR/RpiR family transcriptional regulator [Falsiroseomonas sp. E2-1-a20]|uniref:MurR/RpiR family transcriptional regulator n=1 Tax=Falsiroseomonas sp. E2-1-a20 TaxID=3239300 RepID=UPI003F2E5115
MLDTTLEGRIDGVFDALSGQLRSAARFVADHPAEVAMHSMRRIAQQAGVAPVTMLRLARRLGLGDYNSLRSICRDRVRESTPGNHFAQRARALQARGTASEGGGLATDLLAADLLAADRQNLEHTLCPQNAARLQEAMPLLAEARRVLIVARRSCYPVACCFHYAYSLFRTNAVLLEDRAGSFGPELLDIGPSDVLLAVSFEPYSAETITTVETAREAGASILALTDTEFSPLARAATVTLLAANGSPAFLQSIVAATALVQALVIGVFISAGQAAVSALEQKEARLRARSAYSSGPAPAPGRVARSTNRVAKRMSSPARSGPAA